MARLEGTADLPLHSGNAPPWLFRRMRALGGALLDLLIKDAGQNGAIERISDPFWFQALSCLLGFDWHSSGTTTVTLAALKAGARDRDLPVHIYGGKGRAATSVPEQLEREESTAIRDDAERLRRISRTAARVDTLALQDGYDLYHHTLIVSERGAWAVVQQGLNAERRYARRYHWSFRSEGDMVAEPHTAIIGLKAENVMDLTSHISEECRKAMVEAVNSRKAGVLEHAVMSRSAAQSTLDDFSLQGVKALKLEWGTNWRILRDNIERIAASCPANFEELISVQGVGKKTILALAMASSLVYGTECSWRDPVKYSFAVGGKDGIPYPVDTSRMERMTEIIEAALRETGRSREFRRETLGRLSEFFEKGSMGKALPLH